MAVPEAPVHEDHGPPCWEHEIGFSRQFRAMQAIAEAGSVQYAPDEQLRLRVLATDARHVESALFGRQRIDPACDTRLGARAAQASSASGQVKAAGSDQLSLTGSTVKPSGRIPSGSTLSLSISSRAVGPKSMQTHIHRDMSRGIADVFGDFLQMPLARTFDLYELWAYLRLVRAAVDRFGADGVDVAGLFDGGSGITLAAGQVVVRLPAAGLALCFQRRYREFWIEKDGRGSFSREMRPDVTIEALEGSPERLIVLDAKYRIGAGLNEALASAHMYRDALVSAGADSPIRRIVGAAYLLSPDSYVGAGDWRKTGMPSRLFHPAYRSEFRFGAVTLAPGMTAADIRLALDTILEDAEGGEDGAPP